MSDVVDAAYFAFDTAPPPGALGERAGRLAPAPQRHAAKRAARRLQRRRRAASNGLWAPTRRRQRRRRRRTALRQARLWPQYQRFSPAAAAIPAVLRPQPLW